MRGDGWRHALQQGDTHPSKKNVSEKITCLTIVLFWCVGKISVQVIVASATVNWFTTVANAANINSQQLYVFNVNNKAPPPTCTPKKCTGLFPYFLILDSRLQYITSLNVIPLEFGPSLFFL